MDGTRVAIARCFLYGQLKQDVCAPGHSQRSQGPPALGRYRGEEVHGVGLGCVCVGVGVGMVGGGW